MSFNVQNAVALEIEEGVVKTIHDKNNVQLWGAVGYDVKYKGDTSQTTYTGKNLWGGFTGTYNSLQGFQTSWNKDGTVDITGTASANGWSDITSSSLNNNRYISLPAGTYTFYFTSNASRAQLVSVRSDGTGEAAPVDITASSGQQSFTLTETRCIYPRVRVETTDNGLHAAFMIVSGSSAGDYEPYTGSTISQIIPSPNPDYPQDIHVVTGDQTVTVGSTSYTLSLGSIELAKIGSYQDYIYKSGGNWYKHGEIGKVVLDGTEGSWSRVQVSGATRYFTVDATDALIVTDTTALTPVVCDNFTSQTPSNIHLAIPDYGISLNTGTAKFRFRDKDYTETSDFKTWLSTHNTTVYYALATATDELIVDADLVSDLDAIQEFMKRYGYTATVSGNLPIIIDRQEITS